MEEIESVADARQGMARKTGKRETTRQFDDQALPLFESGLSDKKIVEQLSQRGIKTTIAAVHGSASRLRNEGKIERRKTGRKRKGETS